MLLELQNDHERYIVMETSEIEFVRMFLKGKSANELWVNNPVHATSGTSDKLVRVPMPDRRLPNGKDAFEVMRENGLIVFLAYRSVREDEGGGYTPIMAGINPLKVRKMFVVKARDPERSNVSVEFLNNSLNFDFYMPYDEAIALSRQIIVAKAQQQQSAEQSKNPLQTQQQQARHQRQWGDVESKMLSFSDRAKKPKDEPQLG